MRRIRNLEVYELSMSLVQAVYGVTRGFPDDERYGLTSQLRRASVSIPSNLAEGGGRGGDAEFARFLTISMGSCQELIVQLEIAKRLGYGLSGDEGVFDLAERVGKSLYGLWLTVSGSREPAAGSR